MQETSRDNVITISSDHRNIELNYLYTNHLDFIAILFIKNNRIYQSLDLELLKIKNLVKDNVIDLRDISILMSHDIEIRFYPFNVIIDATIHYKYGIYRNPFGWEKTQNNKFQKNVLLNVSEICFKIEDYTKEITIYYKELPDSRKRKFYSYKPICLDFLVQDLHKYIFEYLYNGVIEVQKDMVLAAIITDRDVFVKYDSRNIPNQYQREFITFI